MSNIMGNGDAALAAETGTVQREDPVFTDLIMEDLEIQISPSLQDGGEGKANARAIAYWDRILEAAGRFKEIPTA